MERTGTYQEPGKQNRKEKETRKKRERNEGTQYGDHENKRSEKDISKWRL